MVEVKQKLIEIFGSQIKFNKEFDSYINNLKENMKEEFIKWCVDCKEGLILGSVPPKKHLKDLYVFFRKIGNNIRAVLIKKQNSNFIEIILSNHLDYDNKRKQLGYKKSSYYGS